MRSTIHELAQRIQELEEELEAELTRRRESVAFVFKGKKVRFALDLRNVHRQYRENLLRFLLTTHWMTYLTAPVIYSQILPVALLDLSVTVYQSICFPAYGIRRVQRGQYLVVDRHQLIYLNLIEKLNCAYCGYANGVIAYAREVAARTEQYWCPVKHARKVVGAHQRYKHFLEFGDAEGYRSRLEDIRNAVRAPHHRLEAPGPTGLGNRTHRFWAGLKPAAVVHEPDGRSHVAVVEVSLPASAESGRRLSTGIPGQ